MMDYLHSGRFECSWFYRLSFSITLLILLFFASSLNGEISENHCDVSTRYDFFKTPCINCWQNRNVYCPRGSKKVTRGIGTRGCKYEVQVGGSLRPARGCVHTCKQLITESRCCDGFWGPQCQSCPKDDIGAICGGRGSCSDGINGTGDCLCFGNLVGSLCESCSRPQLYGIHCESVCACVHGECDNGINGTGSCFCNSGYGGNSCDIALTSCSSIECSDHASCLNTTGSVRCHCNRGYAGNGSSCLPINPCLTSLRDRCHDNASCVHTGPDQSRCECNDGFSGDGVWCQAIDPCQSDNGGCDANSTVCVYDGPAMSHCECKYGFESFTPAFGCTLKDICGLYEKTTCDPDAACETVVVRNEITVKCTCPPGTMELNRVCYDDLLYELTKLNETGSYANKLNLAIAFFRVTYEDLLFNPSLWTLFIPIDDAFPTSLQNNISSNALWKARARAHIVAGSIPIDFTNDSAKTMYPLFGFNYPVRALRPGELDDGEESYFADLNFMGRIIGKILEDAKPALNGMMYLIDTLLEPTDSESLISSEGMMATLNKLPSLSNFTQLVMKSYSFQRKLQQTSSYALFAPTNDAISAFSEDELNYISHYTGRSSLEELLTHSMITETVSIFSIARFKVIRNFETIPVNVSYDDGSISIGNERAKVLKSEIALLGKKIYIHVIDKVLVPDSIKPIVINRCDVTIQRKLRGPCGHCGRTLCPLGGKALPPTISQPVVCVYKTEVQMGDGPVRMGPRMGCNRLCMVNTTTTGCCPGFYGAECRRCPGPGCNGNGVCSDGRSGTGLCTCNDKFAGVGCEKCVNGTKYGPECNSDCPCKNGQCQNTVTGGGQCVPGSCAEGWAGENCDRNIVLCTNDSILCHQFATCVVKENGNSSCVCDPGYTGSGDDCIPFNPCQSLDNGCDVNAFCLHIGKGKVLCECLPNYSGDGRTCAPIDPCASENVETRCSEHAECIFLGPGRFNCRCKEGFRGSGEICTEINLCEENNGGCHQRAQCLYTGPGMRRCECYSGYEGDGMICLGNVLQEISLRSDLSQIQTFISIWINIKLLFINIDSDFTCFLPNDIAWSYLSPDDVSFWLNERHLPFLFKNHIVKTRLPSAKLKTLMGKSVQTLLQGLTLDINTVTVETTDTDVEDQVVEHSTLPTIGKITFAKLLVSDLPVSHNGIIHIIDSILLPPRDVVEDHPALSAITSNMTGTKFEPYGKFLKLLVSTGIIDQIEESLDSYTLFLAPDTAPNFPSTNSTDEVQDILRYHVIMGSMIREASNVKSGQHESSLLGPGYKLTLVRRHEQMLVNGQAVSIVGLRSENGVIHGLSEKFLTPVKTRCDGSSTEYVSSTCLPCSYPNQCPGNSKLIKKTPCLFSHKTGGGAVSASVGCSMKCVRTVPQPKCCPGFYGDGCDPCPGGVGNVCFGFGTCYDGMKGNGSCVCSDLKYSGVACETCAPNKYGRNCDQDCQCDKGKCSDGLNGDGTCSCFLGYRGTQCDSVADPRDSCGGICHTAADCVRDKTSFLNLTQCVCSYGYKGDGRHCDAVNPCKDGTHGCHIHADCSFLKPGYHNCTCKKNYEGDGKYCSPVNPCLKGYDENCDENAYCSMIAPNVSSCVCNTNYRGDGKYCEPENPCEKDHGRCSENAVCKMTGPGTRECRCKDDFYGDGIICVGTIYSFIASRPKYSWFALMDAFASLVPHILTKGPVTVFLPSQTNMRTLSTKLLSYEEPATQLYLNHIIGCVSLNNLTGVTKLRTLAGDILTVSKEHDEFKINNNISVSGPLKFWNGYLYEIDFPIIPKSLTRILNATSEQTRILKFLQPYVKNASDATNPLYKNVKLLLDNGFQWVTTLLENSGDLQLLQNPIHNPWTMFLPADNAFLPLPAQRIRSFLNADGSAAREYIRYHMVESGFIDPSVMFSSESGKIFRTLQGSNIMVKCARNSDPLGELTVEGATVVGFDVFPIATSSGKNQKAAIFIIDKVLEPPSIGGRCDIVDNVTINTECTLCFASAEKCPESTTLIEKKSCKVPVVGRPESDWLVTGCQLSCAKFNVTHKCCSHHYGQDCRACPGGAQSPCSGNGECDEGLDGAGKCTCKEGFMGYACDRCLPSRYGRNCLPCLCTVHGSCDEGIEGQGTCFCDSNWSGTFCDEKRSDSTICNPPCHSNGYCVKSGTCFCKPGYRGDGVDSCEFMDMCKVNNGGCSPYATCSIVRDTVVCKCLPNFIGDGHVCDGYDPCTTSNGGCHPRASCVYKAANVSRCECNSGYQGDGIRSCYRRKAANCAENNGGCSGRAICVDVPAKRHGEYPSTNCSCKAGFIGDGVVCRGTVLSVISELSETRNFYRELRRLPFGLRRRLDSSLSKWTVFVPREIPRLFSPRFRQTYVVTRHMVEGSVYYLKDLSEMKGILMKSGSVLPITKTASDIYINGVKIQKYDIIATNGVLHLIDSYIKRKTVPVPSKSTSSPSVSPSKPTRITSKPKNTPETTRPASPGTVQRGGTIDQNFTPKSTVFSPRGTSANVQVNTNTTKPSETLTSTRKTISDVVNQRRRANGIKIGVSVLVIGLIMVGVGVVYWWNYRRTGGFTPFRERQRLTSDPNEEDTFSGLTNPAYDSTGFNTTDDDDVILRDTDDIAAQDDEQPISFENPGAS